MRGRWSLSAVLAIIIDVFVDVMTIEGASRHDNELFSR